MGKSDKNWKNKILDDPEFFGVKVEREGRELSVAELREGHEIITSYSPRTGRILKTVQVKDRKPCDGGNGMHVHINKSNCYDSRSTVWVK